jgi:hypothetical protein
VEDDIGSLTLGDGEGLCGGWARDFGFFGVVACWKISASCLSAPIWSLPIVPKGAAGAGFSRACVRSFAAMVALSAEDMRGMRIPAGKIGGVNSALATGFGTINGVAPVMFGSRPKIPAVGSVD